VHLLEHFDVFADVVEQMLEALDVQDVAVDLNFSDGLGLRFCDLLGVRDLDGRLAECNSRWHCKVVRVVNQLAGEVRKLVL
jgi:hypothetical protein